MNADRTHRERAIVRSARPVGFSLHLACFFLTERPLRLGVYQNGRPEEQIHDALMSGACAEGGATVTRSNNSVLVV